MDSSEAVEAEITSSKVAASPLERLSDLALGTSRDNTASKTSLQGPSFLCSPHGV